MPVAVDAGQVIQAVVIGLPSFALGYLAYRRSRKVDAVAEQSGVATETRAGIAQIIDGLNKLIDQQQEDLVRLRDALGKSVSDALARDKECNEMRKQLNRLNRKYGDNDSNGDQPRGQQP